MTLQELQSAFLGGASVSQFEDWPRTSQWIALAALTAVSLAVAALLWLRPAWQHHQSVQSAASAMTTALASDRASIAQIHPLQTQLAAVRLHAENPLSPNAIVNAVRAPGVSALDSAGSVLVSGRGDVAALVHWLSASQPTRPLVARWDHFAVERVGALLEWEATLTPMSTQVTAQIPQTAADSSHASRLGRDPFQLFGPANAAPGIGAAPVAAALPMEQTWPLPQLKEWPLESIRLLGTMGGDALVAAGRSVYRVSVGTRLGREALPIRSISTQYIQAGAQRIYRSPQMMEGAR